MSKTFAERLAEDRRLVILRLLEQTPGYFANESLIHSSLADFGLAVSRDQVRTDLSWLAEQGLATNEDVAGVMVVCATTRGLDTAAGRAIVPGVKRPGPR